jgi:hypothetical protein
MGVDDKIENLLTGLLGLPLAVVRDVVSEDHYYHPQHYDAVCAQLERLDEARLSGVLSDGECVELENELLQRLMNRPGR